MIITQPLKLLSFSNVIRYECISFCYHRARFCGMTASEDISRCLTKWVM
jgi:hypothetical protein